VWSSASSELGLDLRELIHVPIGVCERPDFIEERRRSCDVAGAVAMDAKAAAQPQSAIGVQRAVVPAQGRLEDPDAIGVVPRELVERAQLLGDEQLPAAAALAGGEIQEEARRAFDAPLDPEGA
jgi:hypothetical protein